MVAPSKSFTVIADSAIDPDSPLTTGLFTNFRDNDIHLEEWLGDAFTAAKDHNHDDVNSKRVPSYGFMLEQNIVSGGPITSFDFAATLDGNTDRVYLILARVQNSIGSARTLSFRVNGASLGSLLSVPASPAGVQLRMLIHAKNDFKAIIRSDELLDNGAFSTSFLGRAASSANITSLGFEFPDAAMDNGSEFQLFLPVAP